MGKHTPGVWKVELMGGTIRAVDIEGNDVGLIADAHNEISRANLREAVKNHNLVPELLDALKETCANALDLGYCKKESCKIMQDILVYDFKIDISDTGILNSTPTLAQVAIHLALILLIS